MTSPDAIPRQILRVIDASLNRVGEGLRFLEDVARLLLNDIDITQQLKTMRHELVSSSYPFQQELLQSRDSEGDVGVDLEVPGEEKEKELLLVVVANSRRVQEALRSLEEMAKLPGIPPELDSEKFKQARFNIYDLEQKLVSRLLRRDKIKYFLGLYVIIDTSALKGRHYIDVAREVIRGGARAIQLRDKVQSRQNLLAMAGELKAICAEHNVLFVMNDYLDIALAADAGGLHLGQDDLPVRVARRLLPLDKIIGCSVTTVEQAISAQSEGADYVAVSAIYPTPSKEGEQVIGLAGLSEIRQAVSIPVVAIGGITRDNASEVIAAGADAVAVISAVLGADSPEEASRQIVESLEIKNEWINR